MTEVFTPLRTACSLLSSDRVNERKKQLDAVKKELGKRQVQEFLDRNGDGTRSYTWDDVFKSVWGCITRDIELLRGSGSSSVRTSATNVQRSREVRSTLRWIVGAANRRGPKLGCSTLVKHLMSLLRDDFSSSEFGADCCNILTKEVLACRSYWCELNQNTWQELIKVVTLVLHKTPSGVTSDPQARAVQALVLGATLQGILPTGHLFKFFNSVLKKIKAERSATVVACLLSALNVFSLHAAPDCRQQLCKLGEDSFKNLISVWKTNSTSGNRDELVKFFKYQMRFHHPRGVTSEEEGAFATDFNQWKTQVEMLYEELVTEWRQEGAKLKLKSGGKRETSFKKELVELAADVCHQVFKTGHVTFEVKRTGSQMMSNRPYSQMTTPAKRRRLESGWEMLRERISQPMQHTSFIPWLQLIARLTSAYPRDLPAEEFHAYITALHHLQAQSKRFQLQSWVFKCLRSLATSQTSRGDLTRTTVELLDREWIKVWSATMRSICLHSAEDEGFDLLTSLLNRGIVKPDKDVWKLFLPDVTRPSKSSVTFLAVLLHTHPLPENHVCQVGLLASMTGAGKGQHPLRRQLLNWLLPAEEIEEAGERLAILPKILKSVPLDMLAHLLCALCAKKCRCLSLPSTGAEPTSAQTRTDTRLGSIEDLYLEASFRVPLQRVGGIAGGIAGRSAPSSRGGVVVRGMVDAIVERLSHVTNQLTESQCKEVDHYEAIGHLACLVSRLVTRAIDCLEETGRHSLEGLLTKQVKVLLKRLTSGFKELSRKTDSTSDASAERTNSLISLSLPLLSLYECSEKQQGEGERVVAHQLRSSTPSELLDILLDIVHNKGSRGKPGSLIGGHDLFGDPMDLGSDEESSGTQAQNDLDDEFGNVTTIGTSSIGKSSEKGCRKMADESIPGIHSPMSPGALRSEEQLAVSCARVLSAWCRTPDQPPASRAPPAANGRVGDRDTVAQKLLEELSGEVWDESTPYGIQLFFAAASNVVHGMSSLSYGELNSILLALRALAAANRKVQEVCLEALKFLQAVSPLLSLPDDDGMVSTSLKECRKEALLLLAGFWKLKSTYTTPVRHQLALCMESLIKADPMGQWTLMRLKVKEKGQGDTDEMSKVRSRFPMLLNDGAHDVRMHMSAAIGCLFYSTPDKSHNSNLQSAMFDVIYQTGQEAMQVPDKLSDSKSEEEVTNRTSSLLLTLAHVVVQSAVCEKKAIFALLQTTRINRIPGSVMQKVLSCIAQSVTYCNTGTELAEMHLGYLIYQWLQENYPLEEFPYSLLGFSSYLDFLRKYNSTIIPHLVTQKQLDAVKSIGESLDQDWKLLLRASFPRTIASLLPLLAGARETREEEEDGQQERAAWAIKCLEEVEKAIGKETRDAWIQSQLASIVIQLLTMLYEPSSETSDTASFMTECDPEPDPPHFTSYVIKATLDYLTTCHAGGHSLTLVSLLAKSNDSIQRVLLELHVRMAKSTQPHEKRRILLSYRLFGLLLIRELNTGLGNSWVFVLEDLVHTLVHTIGESRRGLAGSRVHEGSSIIRPCLDLLQRISQVAVGHCADEFSKHIGIILGAAVPLIDGDGSASEEAVSLVEFLVMKSAPKLDLALQYLNPLPNIPVLRQARQALEETRKKCRLEEDNLLAELNHFLMRGGQHGKSHTAEGLDRLHQELASRKPEMSLLVSMCAENSTDSVMPQLICELVSLCGLGQEAQALVQGAARCLGEIGAPDLSVIALTTPSRDDKASHATAVETFTEANDSISARNAVILHLLKEYLTNPCVDTVTAAAGCLKRILATPSGQRFYDEYKQQNIDTLLAYLHPFRTPKKKIVALPSLDSSDEAFRHHVSRDSLWQPEGGTHEKWLKDLTVALLKSGGVRDEILRLLEPVCTAKVEFAERVFPYLVHDVLSADNIAYRQVLSEQVRAVFERFTSSELSPSPAPTPLLCSSGEQVEGLSHRSIKTLLDMVHYLRTQMRASRLSRFTAWDNNFWLDVDYLVIAKAAQMCQAHFTCILYSDLWCHVQRMEGASTGKPVTIEPFSQDSPDSLSLGSLSSQTGINVQTLLMDAYGSIGEPDSMYGSGAGRLVNTSTRIHTYEHEGEWGKALAAYDLQMQSSNAENSQLGLLQAMQKFGLASIMHTYLEGQKASGPTDDSHALAEYQFEAAWRNAQWDLNIEDCNLDEDMLGYHGNIYAALGSLRSMDRNSFDAALNRATLGLAHLLADVSMESVQRIYPLLARLQGLEELRDAAPLILSRDTDHKPILAKWTLQLPLMTNDFDFSEPTLALRSALLLMVSQSRGAELQRVMHDWIGNHLKTLVQWARDAGRFQVAERALLNLKEQNQTDQSIHSEGWSSGLEEAQLFWAKGERTTALHLIKAVSESLSKKHSSNPAVYKTYATALSIHGNWLAETRWQSPNVIMEDHLEKSVNIFDANKDTSEPAIIAYHSFARFADAQYQRLVEYMKSKDYEAKRALLKNALKNVEKLRAIGMNVKDRHFRILEKQSEIDKQEVDSLMQDRAVFLHRAMENYLRCLESSDETQDTRVFRVCSLWFENASDDEVSRLLEDSAGRIESRRFLPLMYQLAARMTMKTQARQRFYGILNGLIKRVALDHPHHGLPVILALANANKDAIPQASKRTNLGRSNSGLAELSPSDQDRMHAAQDMCKRLESSQSCSEIISSLNRLSDAYIQLAYWDVTQFKKQTKPIAIASSQLILQLTSLNHAAVPTLELKVNPSCCYDDIVYVHNFEPMFKLAGGLNLPKIISCLGSDGVKRRQLVKANDDLRQDAVMQQVFGLVNQLLSRNAETKRRNLQIRRYKVVPLCQRSGILEWCEGTIPLGLYLIGDMRRDFGAHKQYRPTDWSSLQCRGKMAAAHQTGDNAIKFREYSKVCKYFQPVFHHFFLERFRDPTEWFEKRLSYTRSVATGSIVGYVVGLGDRHVQNILMDCNTAELVHIDLGIAFEQGRNLPTPETVPFRLTRDLVDAMGVAGVEGVFRRCSEKTMEVMHQSREALLTVVEVLLYDPLYTWTLSPAKALALQQLDRTDVEASELNTTATETHRILSDAAAAEAGGAGAREDVNQVAERVLLRLRQKLGGVEDGVTLSVGGQVSLLIQEARDPKNLSRLFPGWQPWI